MSHRLPRFVFFIAATHNLHFLIFFFLLVHPHRLPRIILSILKLQTATKSQSNLEVKAPSEKISVKCCGRRLVKLISVLNDAQKDAVKAIGFGGLLELTLTSYPTRHVPLFFQAFNDGSYVFRASELKEFMVTKHDVHDCFLLPLGPKDIVQVPTGRFKHSTDDEFKKLKDRWRSEYGVTDPRNHISLGKTLSDMEADKEGGDQFRRLFVLFSMSSFLRPTSNNGVDMKLLKAVEDVTVINQYDWCSYVLDGMVSAGLESKKSPTFLLGCIPFLMITYFQRFDFRGATLPHDLPLIKHWDEEKISARLKAELSKGPLGRQTWSSVKYPRCIHLQSEDVIKVDQPPKTVDTSLPKAHKSTENKSIKIDLEPGVDGDQDLQDKAVDGLHELYLQMQRNAVAFHDWYAQATSKIKRLTTQRLDSLDLVPSQSTQAFFEDVAVHRYVDEVIDITKQMKNSASKAPVFQGVSTETQKIIEKDLYSTPEVANVLNDLIGEGHLEDEDGVAACGHVDGLSTATQEFAHGLLYSTGEVCDVLRNLRGEGTGKGVDVGDVHCKPVQEGAFDVGDIEVQQNLGGTAEGKQLPSPVNSHVIRTTDFHKYLLHRTFVCCSMGIVPDNLGCSIYCGEPDPDRLFLTEGLSREKSMFDNVLRLRKDVMDYIFNKSEGMNKLETLVSYNDVYFIPRDDMWSMEPGVQVTNNVIDCWSLLLNHMTYSNTAPIKTSRCFFGLSHSITARRILDAKEKGLVVNAYQEVFDTWDMWTASSISPFQLDSKLVFIPSLSNDRDHYSCACINFGSGQVEYLDNRYYGEEFQKTPYARLFTFRGISKGEKVRGFPLVNMQFTWQGAAHSRNDCGVYTMLHMLLYCGDLFECFDPLELDRMQLYRAEIAATLVLSDINIVREAVLSCSSSFNKQKDQTGNSMTASVVFNTPGHSTRTKRTLSCPIGISIPKRRRSMTPSSSVIKSRPRGRGDGLGCSLYCDPPDQSALVISKTLRANQALLKDVDLLRKQVADYCFLDDHCLDPMEVVADYGPNALLLRNDILSMLPETRMNSILIDCWSLVLNRIESEENEVPRMAFFGIRQMDIVVKLMETASQPTQRDEVIDSLYHHWDQFIKDSGMKINLHADLIFIPLHIDFHYACICINFVSRTVDVLDQMTYPDWKESDVYKASCELASAMSDYLDTKGVDRGSDVVSFVQRKIDLKFKNSSPTVTESGCITMMHMLIYEGDPFEHPDLQRKIGRRYLVIQMASTLVLADINTVRGDVRRKVKKFEDEKESIWKEVYQIEKSNRSLGRNEKKTQLCAVH
ncbi:hypothetical protein RND81_06G108000 [Saponaria officinalis]|uniref:Ubiquitin-like protease family profile domain-containing protein n=1 Tax=Saponaria officinalis TaxID=3572 RepID=A0AAW1K4V3_SAPOF